MLICQHLGVPLYIDVALGEVPWELEAPEAASASSTHQGPECADAILEVPPSPGGTHREIETLEFTMPP